MTIEATMYLVSPGGGELVSSADLAAGDYDAVATKARRFAAAIGTVRSEATR
jgi:hypothetical protein